MTNPEIAKYDDMVEELLHLKRLNAELLAALELTVATINRLYPRKSFSSVGGTLDIAMAAIAKATGKE